MTHHAPDLTHAIWRRSSHSNTQGNQCVEIAAIDDRIAIRDSKNPDREILLVSRGAWATFMTGIALPPHLPVEGRD